MNIQSVSFTGKDYAHAVREAQSSKVWREMKKQIESNRAKIDGLLSQLQNPTISNSEKKTILVRINRLRIDIDRMSERLENHI